MTNEEWDRKTEFLLNQQAKFDAEMQELKQEFKEVQKINEQKFAHAAEISSQVAESVTTLAETVKDFITSTHEGFRSVFDSMKHSNDRIDALINSQIRTDENQRDIDERLRDIEKRQRDLAAIFDRYIRKGHQGLDSA